jgi:hypothetical protein
LAKITSPFYRLPLYLLFLLIFWLLVCEGARQANSQSSYKER